MKALAILRSAIPRGGFGRRLTSTEARDLRAAGYVVSARAIVVRHYDSPVTGWVYRPSPGVNAGFDCTGIRVTTV